jgi:dienelactone hydrolase
MHAAATGPQPTRIIALSDGANNALTGNWPDRVFTTVNRAELHAFEIAAPRASAIVCGGGGYVQLVYDREGVEVARWLNGLGFNAYVLVHRLPGNGNAKDIALTDALSAFGHIPDTLPRIAVGLSSGGHLAGTISCRPEADIKAAVVGYAPLNANHKDYKAPAGKPDFPPPEKQAFYDDWPIGIAAEPHGIPACPVFLAYALHDTAVPIEHALNAIKTARDLGLDLDAHIFGQAPHGFALRDTSGTHRAWAGLAEAWLAETLIGYRP